MYKRIANASSEEALKDLQVEMIDRFGLLPDATRTLFRITALKLVATPLGVRKVDLGARGGRVTFVDNPDVDPSSVIRLLQEQPKVYRFDGPERLRIQLDLPDTSDRLDMLFELFGLLQARRAA
jgi:transcription-repair coupling factor (superfamily II helicase)